MRKIAVLAAFLAFGSAAFAADFQLMNMVPGWNVLGGVDVSHLRASPFGQYLISKIPVLGSAGFNPLQDVSEVLVANTAEPGGFVLARGKFNVDEIVAALASRANGPVQTFQGATLIGFTDPRNNSQRVLALIGDSIAVLGDRASVEAAISRNSARFAISRMSDPAMEARVAQVSASGDAWVVSTGPVASLFPPSAIAPGGSAAQALPLLSKIRLFSGGANFAEEVQLTGQAITEDSQTAADLGAALKLAASLAPLLQSLQVSTDGSTVHFSLSIPEAQLDALLNAGSKHLP